MISVKRFEGMLIFLKSSRLQYILKCQFHTECGVYLVGGFGTKSTLEKGVEVRKPRGNKIRRTWLGRHLLGDLFQRGPQSVDLRESLCRIKRARGSGVTQAIFLSLSETSFYPVTGIFRINSRMQNILCVDVRGFQEPNWAFETIPSRCLKRKGAR